MSIDIRTREFGKLFSEDKPAAPPMSARERHLWRRQMFAESFSQRGRRWLGSLRKALREFGIGGFAYAAARLVSERLDGLKKLPDPERAAARPDGFCGGVDSASPERLLEGYARGLHIHEICGVLTWWAPAHRRVARPEAVGAHDKVRDMVESSGVCVTLDRNFERIVKAYGARERVSPQLLQLFCDLHDMGFAHCFELRDALDAPVAAGFGLIVGRSFITISAHSESAALRNLGISVLDRQLAHLGFTLHDCLGEAGFGPHGFTPITRSEYFSRLVANYGGARVRRWQVEHGLSAVKRHAA